MAACLVIGLATSTVGAQDAGAGRAIRSVDFRNFTYESCIGAVRVHDGTARVDRAPTRGVFQVTDVIYGDLTGDGQEEAVVLTVCSGGGSMIRHEGSIYAVRDGTPELVANIEGGDRADGGISHVEIVSGRLVVTRYGTDDGLCCPTFTVTTTYRLDAGRLVEEGAPVRRSIER